MPLLVFPAKTGTHAENGHRPSPVGQDVDISLGPPFANRMF